jgi:hypothetical protein
MWKSQKKRANNGSAGTFKKTEHHESMKQDVKLTLPNSGVKIASLIDCRVEDNQYDNLSSDGINP